jgi:hypothetical protein
MKIFTKDHILAEIKRTAAENDGKPLGIDRFRSETGIKPSDWQGKLWARWAGALAEAGFEPNKLQGPRSDDDLLGCLAAYAKELGHFPVANEIKLKARTDPGFPWHNTFARFGNKRSLAARLQAFCLERQDQAAAKLCEVAIGQSSESCLVDRATVSGRDDTQLGYVYLMKSGRHYKIGHTNAVGRREREIAIQLPEALRVVHSIKTDDPLGIEEYWHKRFANRRKNGEWFELTGDDITAFKRRKFM